MTKELLHCPSCQSNEISRNGFNDRGNQSYKCRDCGRRFVLDPQCSVLSDEEIALLERLLLERIAIAGIARVMQRSESCIQAYVNAKAETVSQKVEVTKKGKKPLRSKWTNSGRS